MLLRIGLGALVGAVVIFLWGFLWWAVLAAPAGAYSTLPEADQVAVTEALRDRVPATDVYFVPFLHESEQENPAAAESFMQRHLEGPVFQIYYHQGGGSPASPAVMAKGFLHMLVACLFIAGLLAAVNSSLCCYSARVAFVAGIGLFSGYWQDIGNTIWFFHAPGFALYSWGYDISGWLLVGCVLGGFVKPSKASKVWEEPGK